MDKNDLLLIVNILLGLVAFFGAMVGRNLTEAIKELKLADQMLTNRFDSYVRRDDLSDIKQQISAMFKKLDDIKDALGAKVTRDECEFHRSKCK
jgi:predicted PurR-regulated permease PerM